MIENIRKMVHDAFYDDDADRRANNKKKAVTYQQQSIRNLKCPMCGSKEKTKPQLMYGYVQNPHIDGKRPNCYICKQCGYIMMFHDFEKVSDYHFGNDETGNVLLKME